MIRRLLTNLRQKPKPVRDKIALGIAGSFTAAVFFVWIYQMSLGSEAGSENQNGDEPRLISQFIDDVKGQVSAVTDSVREASPDEATSSGTSTSEDAVLQGGNPNSIGTTTSTRSATTSTNIVYTYSTTTHTFSTTSVTASPTPPVAREVRIITTNEAGTSSAAVLNE